MKSKGKSDKVTCQNVTFEGFDKNNKPLYKYGPVKEVNKDVIRRKKQHEK